MKLSCVIPANNESECIERVIGALVSAFKRQSIDYEIVVVNDNSSDCTGAIIDRISRSNSRIRAVHRSKDPGVGSAVRAGIENAGGDAICIVMGDGSDEPDDVMRLFEKLQEGYDLVYGSRFMEASRVYDYPFLKLAANRIANNLVRLLFWMLDERDITNAFKIYRKEVIQAIQPIESTEFNIALELPLKAQLKGFRRAAVAVRWHGRSSDVSKFSVFKMARPYVWTLIKLWCLMVSRSFSRTRFL
ncbi:glycosyltransferase family 2 protein [Candidatus Omnitrophota bacterium]